jgi:hypothetical protein
MTPGQRKALAKWLTKQWASPNVLGVRRDVADTLVEAGYLEWMVGSRFDTRHAAFRLTDKGRSALDSK